MILRFGLKETTIGEICSVLAKHPEVEKAILYGSRAKGNFKNGSDIDLTLCGGSELTINVLYKIIGEIEDLFLPYTFDFSIFHRISDADVVAHIKRVGVTFYEKGKVGAEQTRII
jgi:predicted nucleotidyltransferase